MLGIRSNQKNIFSAENQYLTYVGKETFYGYLAQNRQHIFTDTQFASLYCPDNGRNSVPPSTLAVLLLLQAHDKVADEEAIERSRYDLRWKVALGIGVNEGACAKSTLQEFRAKLVIHSREGEIFSSSIEEAKRLGYFGQNRKMKIAVDTTPIFGKGAVKDTYNLLADGIVKLVRALANAEGISSDTYARANNLSRYFSTSIKGSAEIDWSDKSVREAFLTGIVGDAKRLLEETKVKVKEVGGEKSRDVVEAAELLCRLLVQDVEEKKDGGAAIKEGVAKDRIISTTDTEMRHGRKSSSKRFDGHKAQVAVDTESQLITGASVIAGNAHDSEGALDIVKESEKNTDCEVEKVIGDCAYGGGETRREFKEAEIELVAKVPRVPENGMIPKVEFEIDVQNATVKCPEGKVCKTYETVKIKTASGKEYEVKRFIFDALECRNCKRYRECVKSEKGGGRSVTLHYEEELMQEARAHQKTPEFRGEIKARQTAEHRIARLSQLGIRKSRYFGRLKTQFQLLMAAAVANFTLIMVKSADAASFFVILAGDSLIISMLWFFSSWRFDRRLMGSEFWWLSGDAALRRNAN